MNCTCSFQFRSETLHRSTESSHWSQHTFSHLDIFLLFLGERWRFVLSRLVSSSCRGPRTRTWCLPPVESSAARSSPAEVHSCETQRAGLCGSRHRARTPPWVRCSSGSHTGCCLFLLQGPPRASAQSWKPEHICCSAQSGTVEKTQKWKAVMDTFWPVMWSFSSPCSGFPFLKIYNMDRMWCGAYSSLLPDDSCQVWSSCSPWALCFSKLWDDGLFWSHVQTKTGEEGSG